VTATSAAASTTTALRVEEVSISFGGMPVLTDVQFELSAPFTGIIGPNGAGKTTLFNVVTGVYHPDRGRVFVLGTESTSMPANKVAALGIRRTFQTPKLVPRLDSLHNVVMGMDGGALAGQWSESVGLPRGRRREQAKRELAREILGQLGLGSLLGVRAENLPLPTQKLVEVARGLAARPQLLLLDEPAAGMGRNDVDELLGPVRSAAVDWGCNVVIIEHDVELVSELCQDVLVLDFGRVVAQGPAQDVLASRKVMDAYLGVVDVEG